MATAREAAAVRIACALASITDLVQVSGIDRENCNLTLAPPDALSAGKQFADFGVNDGQMPFFISALADCCPEKSVANAITQLPSLPASMEIDKVVGKLEALLLGVQDWDGTCVSDRCC